MGAVVTASGTGAEMNGGAVITNEAVTVKAGMGAAAPRFAVLDPSYTLTVPRMQVLSGAFDTLSHAMETYFGNSDSDNVSDDVALGHYEEYRGEHAPAAPEHGRLGGPGQPDVGLRHGGERHPESGASHRLPGPPDGAPAGRLHRLQPRPGPGGDPPRLLPVPVPLRQGEIHRFAQVVFGKETAGRASTPCPPSSRSAACPPRWGSCNPRWRSLPTCCARWRIAATLSKRAPRQLTRDEVYTILCQCL